MQVAAVVVAADSGPLLTGCIDALLGSPRVAQLCLFDNASNDGMPQRVAAQHDDDPRLRVQYNARNLGFGAAVNRAAAELAGDWLLVVNPDAVLEAADLDRLLQHAASHADAGLWGALMVNDSGAADPASRRRDPTLGRVLAQLMPGGSGGIEEALGDAEPVQRVENVSGALLLLRRAVWDDLGGFDEGFFLHFEDLDLCRRVRDAGHGVRLATDVRVLHRKGSSSHHRPVFVAWHKHRGMWRWFTKHDPLARRWYGSAFARVAIAAHFLLSLPRALWRK